MLVANRNCGGARLTRGLTAHFQVAAKGLYSASSASCGAGENNQLHCRQTRDEVKGYEVAYQTEGVVNDSPQHSQRSTAKRVPLTRPSRTTTHHNLASGVSPSINAVLLDRELERIGVSPLRHINALCRARTAAPRPQSDCPKAMAAARRSGDTHVAKQLSSVRPSTYLLSLRRPAVAAAGWFRVLELRAWGVGLSTVRGGTRG